MFGTRATQEENVPALLTEALAGSLSGMEPPLLPCDHGVSRTLSSGRVCPLPLPEALRAPPGLARLCVHFPRMPGAGAGHRLTCFIDEKVELVSSGEENLVGNSLRTTSRKHSLRPGGIFGVADELPSQSALQDSQHCPDSQGPTTHRPAVLPPTPRSPVPCSAEVLCLYYGNKPDAFIGFDLT